MIKSYGIPGESQETRTDLNLDAPFILMKSDRPAPHYVAAESGEWVEPEDNREFKHFTGQDKLALFTADEQRAIYTAAYVNADVDVLMVVKAMDNALYLTYSDERTQQGLMLLETKGLITPERHQEIIAVMTADKEP